MTREELAAITDQLREPPIQPEPAAREAAHAFDAWLKPRREKLRAAVLLKDRGDRIPEDLATELRLEGAAAEARRGVLSKAYCGEF